VRLLAADDLKTFFKMIERSSQLGDAVVSGSCSAKLDSLVAQQLHQIGV